MCVCGINYWKPVRVAVIMAKISCVEVETRKDAMLGMVDCYCRIWRKLDINIKLGLLSLFLPPPSLPLSPSLSLSLSQCAKIIKLADGLESASTLLTVHSRICDLTINYICHNRTSLLA